MNYFIWSVLLLFCLETLYLKSQKEGLDKAVTDQLRSLTRQLDELKDKSINLSLSLDATNINITATTGGVDDWSPRISINGNRLIWTNEWHSPRPRQLIFNRNVSSWFRPGNNTVYV